MEPLDFTRSRALNNIPAKKLQEELDAINASSDPIEVKHVKLIATNRYAESNIPIEYWKLKMEKDFVGDPRLKQKYEEYIADLKVSHQSGASFCLAGGHGVGKTMTMTCILKKASQKGYSCLYTTLSDIVSVLIQAPPEDRFLARQELIKVDFLVIDEFDPRFMASDNAADLYARTLESIFRTRSANKQPTLMCTNSPNVVESFHGPLKASIGSLMKGYTKVFPVLGEDVRGRSKENPEEQNYKHMLSLCRKYMKKVQAPRMIWKIKNRLLQEFAFDRDTSWSIEDYDFDFAGYGLRHINSGVTLNVVADPESFAEVNKQTLSLLVNRATADGTHVFTLNGDDTISHEYAGVK